MQIGNIEVLPVYDGRLTFIAPPGIPTKDSPEFAIHRNYITDDGHWLMDIGAFVVRSGNRLMLLDAGAGPGDMEPLRPPPFTNLETADPALLAYHREQGLSDEALTHAMHLISQTELQTGMLGESLSRLGIAPEDITDVVLSHLHFDHVGWVSHNGKPCFSNATYRCERRDAEFFLGNTPHDETLPRLAWRTRSAVERLRPVLNRLEPWDGDAVIAEGVNACFAPGHTPGNCIFVLSSKQERAMILGDAVHCPLELTDPEFSLMTDMDQALADRTRARIRREIDGGDVLVTAPHFPELKFGRMLPGKGKQAWMFEKG
jgi:glyoxylase-like metal-dependent hydrolase (beta-lactamase superfamily II)